MKKKITIAVLLVLLFAVAVLLVIKENLPQKTDVAVAEQTEISDASEGEEAAEEAVVVETIDYDALYKAYAPETVIGTIGEDEVTWEEYYGWLSYNIYQLESTMEVYRTYYGMNYNWSDDNGAGQTFADMMTDYATDNVRGKYAIMQCLDENDLVLGEENQKNIHEQKENDKITCCGEGTSDEEFLSYLKEMHLTETIYEYIAAYNEYVSLIKDELFGAELEKISDEDINNYIVENAYMNVNHILLLTKDMSTGEELDDGAKAEKLAKTEELLAELQKIKNNDELVKKFRKLKDEFCEDSGKAANPDGYVFTEGTMVTEFEEAAKALDDYGLSEIVETTYGYHILLKLPINKDTVVDTDDAGEDQTIGAKVAETKFSDLITQKAEELELVFSDTFKIKMSDYIVTGTN